MSVISNGKIVNSRNQDDDETIVFQRSPSSTLSQDELCGIGSYSPAWLQKLADSRVYLFLYAVIGIAQSMSFTYFVAVITTIEKRFKFPSKITGIIMSGNEVSQIALSLFLTYYGGQGHRPRWLAMGMTLSALSCFITASPHFFYGSGEDVLRAAMLNSDTTASTVTKNTEGPKSLCDRQVYTDNSLANITITTRENESVISCKEKIEAVAPLALIFLANFIAGIGITLYYTVGLTYLDDNVKKSKSPLMFGINYGIRMVGPTFGFLLASTTLKMFINPTLVPKIDEYDPQWIGAWWLGFILIGILIFSLSMLMVCFPKQLPKKLVPLEEDTDRVPLNEKGVVPPPPIELKRGLREFPTALKNLLSNKIFMFNNAASVSYVIGFVGWWTFLPKYMESQYRTTASAASLVAGVTGILVMATGLLVSGVVISRYKPRARILSGWNVIIGVIFVTSQIIFVHVGCTGPKLHGDVMLDGTLGITTTCNTDCACGKVKFSPVCSGDGVTNFYSACHAGCTGLRNGTNNKKIYTECSCTKRHLPFIMQNITSFTSTNNFNNKKVITPAALSSQKFMLSVPATAMNPFESNATMEIVENMRTNNASSRNRSAQHDASFVQQGWCPTDCYEKFVLFIVVMSFMKFVSSTGKLGNLLVQLRCVEKKDKSFALGLGGVFMSILAFLPAPIIYGAIVDTTCLLWEERCGERGNCWLYDSEKLRIYLHLTTGLFIALGTFFDGMVWYHVKGLELYREAEEIEMDVIKT